MATHVSRTIDAHIDEVWPVLDAFGDTAAYNPAVAASRIVGDRPTGLGAVRRCDINADGSKWIQEEIIEYDAANHRYLVEMVEGTDRPPVDRMTVAISATPTADGRTTVSYTAHMEATGIKKVMPIMAGPMLKRVFGKVLDGLEEHLGVRSR